MHILSKIFYLDDKIWEKMGESRKVSNSWQKLEKLEKIGISWEWYDKIGKSREQAVAELCQAQFKFG